MIAVSECALGMAVGMAIGAAPEWMMGLPDGWVTDVGIPRSAQLKALGNGVVPAQAALALALIDAFGGRDA